MKGFLLGIILTIVAAISAAVFWLGSGEFDIAANTPYHPEVERLLYELREKSLAKKLANANITIPGNMADPVRIKRGAKPYHELCAGCHLTPNSQNAPMHDGLNPTPPDFCAKRKNPITDQQLYRQFWVSKHGLKTTAMPAFGKGGLDDESIWNILAFVQALPNMSAEGYLQMIDKNTNGLQEYQNNIPTSNISPPVNQQTTQPAIAAPVPATAPPTPALVAPKAPSAPALQSYSRP